MGDPSAWGLDAAVPAAFLGLVWPRLKSSTDRTLAVVAAFFAIATTPFLPAGLPIIGTALLAVIAGLWVKK
jgi:predicted branched-subunit amino acid permease